MAKQTITLNLNFEGLCSPVQERFRWDKHLEVALLGPRGEGKTEAGLIRATHHAVTQPPEVRPIPIAVVRDTWTNLERTTLRSILHPWPNSFGSQIREVLQISDGGRRITLPGIWTMMLFGVDTLGDLNKLQSLQLGLLWLEEVAPAAATDIGGGLGEDVVKMGITSLRHPCDWRTLQITSNYPDEDHWSWRRYAIEQNKDRRLFRIPRGENPHLPKDYRANMESALSDDPGMLQRLVLGEPGFVVQGVAVTPEYEERKHRSAQILQPIEGVRGYRAWDGGHNPTCVVAQITPGNRLFVYESFVGEKIGMAQLIEEYVQPAMKSRYGMIKDWEDTGDPNIVSRDQGDTRRSPGYFIESMLDTQFISGSTKWETVKTGIKAALNNNVDGIPWVQLSRSEFHLNKALRGGWHYRKSNSGVISDKPIKNIFSHPGDAFAHLCCYLLEMGEGGRKRRLDLSYGGWRQQSLLNSNSGWMVS
jgi:hypothetical protein